MWVKICGTTSLADAQLAIEHGADALGFIFAPSKRRVTLEQAAEITAHLPKGIDRVGVFTAASVPEIVAAVQQADLTTVQLHLPHDPGFTRDLHALLGKQVRVIQVIGVPAEQHSDERASVQLSSALDSCFSDPALWAILLDTVEAGNSGGLGVAFAWSHAKPALVEALRNLEPGRESPKTILAGGLHAGNVETAIAALQPWGVDAVSGVEASPGRKDPERLRQFIASAR